ncbi:MAG TPA: TauD/TfdA family dioxygenase [Micromonosporaceae bacterium]|nr:TauD/TfdA family dioxygenase [Micromonosporaceae bacterium]
MSALNESALLPQSRAPRLIRPGADRDLAAFVAEHHAAIDQCLIEYGAVLFRGFAVASVEHFERVGEALSPQKLGYLYRSTPRSTVGDGVFTTTEYPPDQEVALHCENAYQREWPLKVAFCCLVAPEEGGQTPIADMRRVQAAIGEELMDRFESRGVRYVRHYRPHIDIPWEVVFQTSDRAEVAAYCQAHGIEHEWLDARTLRTAQTSHGTARHPVTGERVFFNQAHLFHVSNLGAEVAASLVNLFGRDRLPRNAYFGDGGEIELADLQQVRHAFAGAAVSFTWQPGDILLLDNMQVAHGRRPFLGPRRIVASLLDSYTEPTKGDGQP